MKETERERDTRGWAWGGGCFLIYMLHQSHSVTYGERDREGLRGERERERCLRA